MNMKILAPEKVRFLFTVLLCFAAAAAAAAAADY
jgi:hypothetical protein